MSSHSITSEAKGTITCPKCKTTGQLKLRKTRSGTKYYQVDHYYDNSHSKGYERSCYLGTEKNVRNQMQEKDTQ